MHCRVLVLGPCCSTTLQSQIPIGIFHIDDQDLREQEYIHHPLPTFQATNFQHFQGRFSTSSLLLLPTAEAVILTNHKCSRTVST